MFTSDWAVFAASVDKEWLYDPSKSKSWKVFETVLSHLKKAYLSYVVTKPLECSAKAVTTHLIAISFAHLMANISIRFPM